MRSLLALLLAALVALPALAQAAVPIDEAVRVCPAAAGDAFPPRFDAPGCETRETRWGGLDPQGRMIWLRATLTLDAAQLESSVPLGLFVLAKASSEVYLNGALLGRNGAPAAEASGETPGLMDVVLPAPRELLRPGENELVLRMSSHHGALRLSGPVHWIALGAYQSPQQAMLARYWPSLVTFGALLAGALYFAVMAIRGEDRRGSALLSAMSLSAAAQLFTEASRSLFAYAYPVHDLRLILILAFSLAFGLGIAAFVVGLFETKRPRTLLLAIAAPTVLAALVQPGFDYKSALAVLVPTLAGIALTGVWTVQRKRGAAAHLAALVLLAGLIFWAPSQFLDRNVFLFAAGYLLFLFVQQALALAEERRLRRLDAERASQLALVLEQREAARPEARRATIKVASAGRIDLVPVDDIAYLEGAGDYVALHLLDGREILHSDSLGALETTLPATFVRVHRSYIVNTAHVRTLRRESSGVGRLLLAGGAEIPVSRRIMPKVRIALDDPPLEATTSA